MGFLGRYAQLAPEVRLLIKDRTRRWKVEHTLSLTAAVLAFMLVFTITGDADLLFAIGTGLGAAVVIYITAQLHIHLLD
jgi:hypothetical protein